MQYSTRQGYPPGEFSPAPEKRRSTGRGRQGRATPCALSLRFRSPRPAARAARAGSCSGAGWGCRRASQPLYICVGGRFCHRMSCCRFPLGLQQGRLFPYVVSLYCSPVSSFTYCIPDPSGCVQIIASFPVSVSPFSNFAPFALLQLALIQLG